jgi:hypothetical protein
MNLNNIDNIMSTYDDGTYDPDEIRSRNLYFYRFEINRVDAELSDHCLRDDLGREIERDIEQTSPSQIQRELDEIVIEPFAVSRWYFHYRRAGNRAVDALRAAKVMHGRVLRYVGIALMVACVGCGAGIVQSSDACYEFETLCKSDLRGQGIPVRESLSACAALRKQCVSDTPDGRMQEHSDRVISARRRNQENHKAPCWGLPYQCLATCIDREQGSPVPTCTVVPHESARKDRPWRRGPRIRVPRAE